VAGGWAREASGFKSAPMARPGHSPLSPPILAGVASTSDTASADLGPLALLPGPLYEAALAAAVSQFGFSVSSASMRRLMVIMCALLEREMAERAACGSRALILQCITFVTRAPPGFWPGPELSDAWRPSSVFNHLSRRRIRAMLYAPIDINASM